MAYAFDHEKLDVYRLSLQFIGWSQRLLKVIPGSCRNSRSQLIRSSDSIPLNIAEASGKRPGLDRKRYFETARASATECAATLDVLVARGARTEDEVQEGKLLLHRIVSILTRLAPPNE